MKNIIFGFILILSFSISAFSQSADEIVKKYINSVGGKEKWDAISIEKKTGKLSMNGMEFPIISSSKRPNLNYTEVSIQGMTMKQAYDGNTGWMINPMTGSTKAEKMDEDMTKAMRNKAIIGGQLLNYKDLGCTIELAGKEKLDAAEAFNIKLTNKEGDIVNYYIDVESYSLIKSTSKVKRMGQEYSSETLYSDYKPVGNVIACFTIETKIAGMEEMGGSQKIIIDKIEYNVEIDDSIFTMPVDHNK
jgi:hypothetical protein